MNKIDLRKVGSTLFFLMMTLIITATAVYAQSAPALPMFPDSPAPAPIDGGLAFLAAAGGAYAYRRLRKKA